VTLAEIAAEPFLLYPGQPRPSFADQVLTIFRAAGLAPSVVLEANEVQTAIGLAVAGVGVTLVPESVKRLRRDELAHVPVLDASARSPVVVSHRAGDASVLLRRFLHFARDGRAEIMD
jgi:DNA-binding transcriptional LysR family regulator